MPATTAWAGPVPDGTFEGQGRDDESVQVTVEVQDRAVNVEFSGLTLKCRNGDDIHDVSFQVSPSSRIRDDQSFKLRFSNGAADVYLDGVFRRNDDVVVGKLNYSGRFDDQGAPDPNGRRCRTGDVPYRAERV